MRIAFLIPPFFRLMGSHNNKVGPSTLSVASILEAKRHKVMIYNADAIEDNEEYADWYSIAKNYWAYKECVKRLGEGTYSMVPGFLKTLQYLEDFKPDVLIICCGDPAIPTVDIGGIEVVHYLIPTLRLFFKDVKFIGYGYAFDFNPVLARQVDMVMPAYGESTVYQLVSRSTRINCRELTRLHLDAVPHSLPLIFPHVDVSNFDYVMASRGCKWGRCVFCPHSAGSPLGAENSPSWFAEEVQYRYDLGIHYQYFSDMDFFQKSDTWINSWKNLMRSAYEVPNLSFSLEARASNVTKDKLLMLKEAGLTTVKIGLEGATDKLLTLYEKGATMRQVQRSIELIHGLDLKLVVYLLLGHPEATTQDYQESFWNANDLGADYYVINVACPYQGTKLFKMVESELVEAGLFKDGIERGFTHLSDDLRQFWKIPPKLFDDYLQLSARTTKEDHGVGQKRYVRNILTTNYV